jgi:tRNA pseudouridine32 synthase/23S rRNA pseudouridine746 synthase
VALAILHRDEHLLAVDKPAGRLVIPGRGSPEPTLQEEAAATHGRLWVVHRLDRGTSGVLLFARTAAAHRALNLAFDARQIAKRYLALVRGTPPARALVEAALAPARRGRMRLARPGDPRAKDAATEVILREAHPARPPLPPLALVEALPRTGRTHQIRLHLASLGTPLALDPDYGAPDPLAGPGGEILLDRTPLHAWRLELAHPVTGATLRLEAPLPADMERLLARARSG